MIYLILRSYNEEKKTAIKFEMWSNYGKTFVEYLFVKKFRKKNSHIKIINEQMRPWCHKEWSYINNDRYYEHFSEVDISNDDIHNCYMIFIYRNPIYSIYSRYIPTNI